LRCPVGAITGRTRGNGNDCWRRAVSIAVERDSWIALAARRDLRTLHELVVETARLRAAAR
jgi:hypothetical protein